MAVKKPCIIEHHVKCKFSQRHACNAYCANTNINGINQTHKDYGNPLSKLKIQNKSTKLKKHETKDRDHVWARS